MRRAPMTDIDRDKTVHLVMTGLRAGINYRATDTSFPVFFDEDSREIESISDSDFRRGIQLTVMVGVVMTYRICP